MPLKTVENDGFRYMLRKFDPRYESHSHNYISRTSVLALHTVTTGKVKKQLADATYFASTTDMWSSSAEVIPFMSYTIHFVDKN